MKNKHFQELLTSSINPDIIRLNFKSLSGSAAYDHLLYSDDLERLNAGRLSSKWLKTYRHLDNGGWYCNGLDPSANWQPMEWGCFKPDTPRLDYDQRKQIKYEHPPKIETRAFFLRVTAELWSEIALRYDVPVAIDYLLSADELSTQFWNWVINTPKIPTVIVEGVKKAASVLSAGYVAIALPGITSGYRTPKDANGNRIAKERHLIPEIELLTRGGRETYLCFDQDAKQKTVRAVNHAIATFSGLLTKAGSSAKVIRWDGKLGKGVDDLITNHGVEAFDEAYNEALTPFQYQRKTAAALTYPVALTVDRRYLGQLSIPEEAKLVCLKAPKGTGKTESIVGMVDEAMQNGQPVLVLTHRVQLGEALCDRFGIPYVTQLADSEVGKLFGYGVCLDSLHPQSQARFNADGWSDALIILDECEQSLWHLLSASTEVKKHRVTVLRQFKQLLTNVINEGGRIVLSDADLSDISIDYVRGLVGEAVQPWICVNEWKPKQGWNVYNYNNVNPAPLVESLEAHIADGGKPFVLCSGQKIKSKWGTQILEKRLHQKFPELEILRVDSETISDPTHPAYGCITSANEVFKNYDIVLGSPAIETGISVDIKDHFTSVWGIAQGNLAETSVRQQLARLRTSVDRHIWAASYGGNMIGNGSTNATGLLASQDKLCKIHIRQLQDTDFDPELIDDTFDQVSLRIWARMAARINAGKVKYREAILEGLQEEGHTIIDVDFDPDGAKIISDELSGLRDDCHQEEAELEEATELVTHAQYEELAGKKAKTKEERLKERKYSRHLKYGVDITAELILKDDAGWHPQIQLHYYSTVGREHLKDRDRKRADAQLAAGNNAVWKPDFNRSQLSAKVAIIEGLGILNLLDPEREYRKTDADLEQMAALAKFNAANIRNALGVTINEKDTPIAILQNLLKKVGLKLTLLRREGSDGDRVRVYGYNLPTDGRDEIYRVWVERDLSTASNNNLLILGVDVA